ncbi:MAG: hypothetical protein CMH46_11900 [Muricauda sp.]|nr:MULTISPECIES: hypothetical protein [unclassified Allomuricauda]MAU16227.1 hypothetical protein [Allomuricauda sp.]|tara:strand:- start:284 stop:718 length:435 start_codon:yes stop_codon:yes gene_type:complete
MNSILYIGVNWRRILPYILDAIFEIGAGIILLSMNKNGSTIFWIGLLLTIFGVVQLIRKIKTFHLSKSHLLIKRPLMPFKFAEMNFELKKIKKIELKRLVRVGPYIRIIGEKDGGYMLAMDKKTIDSLEKELKLMNITVTRENI